MDDLQRFHVRSSNGEMIPLSTLVTYDQIFEPDVAWRYNMYRSAVIQGQPAEGLGVDAIAAMERVAADVLPQGYQYEWTGMAYRAFAGNQAIFAFALACVFIYLFALVSWTLGDYLGSFVPVAFLVCQQPLCANRFGTLGDITAKNAIRLDCRIREMNVKTKMHQLKMRRLSGTLRFRAVNMTSWSFILGIFPLIFAAGAGHVESELVGYFH